jgi:hypothetical protein
VPGKELRVGAHRGGGTRVGWWRDFGATAIGGGGSLDSGRRCPEALLRLYKSEGEVKAEPNWRSGEEAKHGGSPHLGERTALMARPNSR